LISFLVLRFNSLLSIYILKKRLNEVVPRIDVAFFRRSIDLCLNFLRGSCITLTYPIFLSIFPPIIQIIYTWSPILYTFYDFANIINGFTELFTILIQTANILFVVVDARVCSRLVITKFNIIYITYLI
jgi:hypothetical protein